MTDRAEPETFLECRYGIIRLHGETALVSAAPDEVWRGPFRWEIGSHVVVEGPRGDELILSAGEVVSSFRLRPAGS